MVTKTKKTGRTGGRKNTRGGKSARDLMSAVARKWFKSHNETDKRRAGKLAKKSTNQCRRKRR